MKLFVILAFISTLALMSCGRRNNYNRYGYGYGNQAVTPLSSSCFSNPTGCGGYGGLNTNYWSSYPYGANGYNNYGGYYNACNQGWVPVYGPQNYGLGCFNYNAYPGPYASFTWGSYGYNWGNFGGPLIACFPQNPYSCPIPGQICVPYGGLGLCR